MSNDEYTEDVVEVEEEVEETEDEESESDDSQQEQQKESPEAKLARLTRMKAQLEKKLGISTEEKKTSKKGSLDYSQKAYLIASGIKGADEFGLVQEVIKSTGKALEDVIESKYFKAELNELREINKTSDANPSSGNRSGNSARNTVDYWIAKGELPPASEVELRRKVVNARMQKAKSGGQFYNS